MRTNASVGSCPFHSKPGRALRNAVFRAASCLTFMLCLAACDMKPEVLIDGGEVYAESYMWCDIAKFDGKWTLGGGALLKNPVNPPSTISNHILAKGRPFPSEFEVRWFHFGKQKFYEAKLTDPALLEKAFAFVKRYSAFNFDKLLYVSIYDNGKVEFWLGLISVPAHEKKYIVLLGSTQGYEGEGDKSNFEDLTKQAIEEGLIPASVLDRKE